MWPFKPLLPPPVPQELREMLKDYPQHIERLQQSLNTVLTDPVKGQPPFEVAIWVLEGTLDTFVDEARNELEAVELTGDLTSIERSKSKLSLMRGAGFKGRWLGDDAFSNYFQAYQESFE